MMPSDLHSGDVDVVPSEDRSNPTDHSRNIAMMRNHHFSGQRSTEREPIDGDDSRLGAIPGDPHLMRRIAACLERERRLYIWIACPGIDADFHSQLVGNQMSIDRR